MRCSFLVPQSMSFLVPQNMVARTPHRFCCHKVFRTLNNFSGLERHRISRGGESGLFSMVCSAPSCTTPCSIQRRERECQMTRKREGASQCANQGRAKPYMVFIAEVRLLLFPRAIQIITIFGHQVTLSIIILQLLHIGLLVCTLQSPLRASCSH